jgi:hypothetical protein
MKVIHWIAFGTIKAAAVCIMAAKWLFESLT